MQEKLDSLKSASEYFVNLQEGISNAVMSFHSGNEAKGSELLLLIIDGLQWIISVVVLTADMHPEKIDVTEMNEKLEEIVEAFSNQDYILVGDLFQYEIIPILNKWEEQVNQIVKQ